MEKSLISTAGKQPIPIDRAAERIIKEISKNLCIKKRVIWLCLIPTIENQCETLVV